jgi:hypothetical protein
MIAHPHTSSAVHHHGGTSSLPLSLSLSLSLSSPPSPFLDPSNTLPPPPEQDTIIYALAGHGSVVSADGTKRQALAPGDFALIPAWTEHQEVNDGDEEVTWIISRSGGVPVVVNLEGWGGAELKG